MSTVPAGLKYIKEHVWAKAEGDLVRIGITDFVQQMMGDVRIVVLPQLGGKVAYMKIFGTVESAKSVFELDSPVAGEIVEVNSNAERQPELVNQDPYGAGWLILVRPDDPNALNSLLDADAYSASLKEA